MIRDAISKIIELSPPVLNEIDGRTYSNQALHRVCPPLPEPLQVHTLTGLVEHIQAHHNPSEEEEYVFVHVINHLEVKLLSGLDNNAQRKVFARATTSLENFPFGHSMGLEAFIIKLQTVFFQTPATQSLLRLLSNVKDENIKISEDDGISQTVTVRTGPALVQERMVPNPVILQPFRTFLEVEQPASPFVLRMRRERDEIMTALYEADGGVWKLEAIGKIRNFLDEHLPKQMHIIA